MKYYKVKLTKQQKKAQRARNIYIAFALFGLSAVFYAATLVKFDLSMIY